MNRTLPFRDGDVVEYTPDNHERHCREGMAVVVQISDTRYLMDTFWGVSNDGHILKVSEVYTAELLFNVNDYDELERYNRESQSIWNNYAPKDRQRITSQHGLQTRWFIKKGASEDWKTKLGNAASAVEDCQNEIEAAHRRLDAAWETYKCVLEQTIEAQKLPADNG